MTGPTSPSTAPVTEAAKRLATGWYDNDPFIWPQIREVEQEAARRALEALRRDVADLAEAWHVHSVEMASHVHRQVVLDLIDAAISGAAIDGVRESGATHQHGDQPCDPSEEAAHPPYQFATSDVQSDDEVRVFLAAYVGSQAPDSIPVRLTMGDLRRLSALAAESGAALVSGERPGPEAVRLLRAVMAEIDGLSTRYYRASFSEARRFLEGTAAPVGPAPYPPEPSTDGTDHAHDPEQCAACRRQADLFFASGANTERVALRLRADAIPAEIGGDSVRAFVDAEIDNRSPLGPALPPGGLDPERLATALREQGWYVESLGDEGPPDDYDEHLRGVSLVLAATYDRGERAALSAPAAPPWVESLNRRQRDPNLHPYTCPNRADGKHERTFDLGVLTATADGWVCPSCDYRQAYAGAAPAAPAAPSEDADRG